ncbi:MAG TPA: TOBE domain-containing protein [Polyangiales bacterium]
MASNSSKRPRKTKPRASAGASAGIRGRLQLEKDGAPFLGPSRIDLLQAIANEHSISAAARAIGISYKSAWDAIDAMNNHAEVPLVATAVGGSGGGGATLTPYGHKIVNMVRRIEAQYVDALASIGDPTAENAAYQRLLQRLSVRTSARNQWVGTILRVQLGLVQTEVALELGPSLELVAAISSESAHELALRPGAEVCALVKATAITVRPGSAKHHGANHWAGAVTRVQTESERVAITADVASGRTVTAIVSGRPLEVERLQASDPVTIVVPPSSVTLVLPF